MLLEGTYAIRIEKVNDFYFAQVTKLDGDGQAKHMHVTYGNSPEEIWNNIAEANLARTEDVHISWWNRLLGKMRRYRKGGS